MALADIDLDGDTDLLVPVRSSSAVAIAVIINQRGSFQLGFNLEAGNATAGALRVAVADRDSDGRPDLVSAWSQVTEGVRGSGLFSGSPAGFGPLVPLLSLVDDVVEGPGGIGYFVRGSELLDLDGGVVLSDLGATGIVAGPPAASGWSFPMGDPRFGELIFVRQFRSAASVGEVLFVDPVLDRQSHLIVYPDQIVDAIALGDVDGDGVADLLAGHTGADSTPTALFVQYDGGFSHKADFDPSASCDSSRFASFTLADLDVDGFSDAAFACAPNASGSAPVFALINNGQGQLASRMSIDFGSEPCLQLEASDFNRDCRVDLACLTSSGVVVAYGQ